MDRTTDGRSVKMLTMIDEYTRQCLVIHPARSITSDQVLDTLQHLADLKGATAYIRSGNGSEFIAQIIQDWCFFRLRADAIYSAGQPMAKWIH